MQRHRKIDAVILIFGVKEAGFERDYIPYLTRDLCSQLKFAMDQYAGRGSVNFIQFNISSFFFSITPARKEYQQRV